MEFPCFHQSSLETLGGGHNYQYQLIDSQFVLKYISKLY